ncbi:MAG: alanine dehydrogenase [Gammaproteobacteria bacterium]
MLIGVPKEIKKNESRVGLTVGSVRELINRGHQVMVETNAGLGIGMKDEDYSAAGAHVVNTAEEIFAKAEMVVKVKEPQPEECKQLRPDQILFTYLHLAPDPIQTNLLMESGCTAIAYETVTDDYGRLPLLAPMSEVAGRMSIQAGAFCLEKINGGSGVLLGGVPGVEPAHVVVLGGGVVGTNAVRIAMGMEAQVTVMDKSLKRLNELDYQFGSRLNTIYATTEKLEHYIANADLVIGAVLVPGASAPRLVTRDMLKTMREGAVVVDVAIDQGGCIETARATTHTDPTYIEEGVVHYCVANMPGAVPRTSTFALNNATLTFVLDLANNGAKAALLGNKHLLNGLNVHQGYITCKAVAEAMDRAYKSPEEVL